PRLSSRARAIASLAWVGLGLSSLAVVWIAYPVHFVEPKGGWITIDQLRTGFAVGWLLLMLLIGWGWRRLRYRPFRPTLRGHTYTLDLDWFCRWFLGRRVWVSLGIMFHLHLVLLMNIGWFQPGALSGFICFLGGAELAMLLTILRRRLARVPGLPKAWRSAPDPVPAEDPTLPHHHRDAARLPTSAIVAAAVGAAVGVPLQVFDVLHFGWTLVGLFAFLAGAAWRDARSHGSQPLPVEPRFGPIRHDEGGTPGALRMPWAYGPLGRLLVGSLTLYHVVGVACWLLPEKDCMSWRIQTHEPFRKWLEMTHTTQGWSMFAPNPPRANLFLRVRVTDSKGEVFDMNTDVYHPSQRPIPWIWYTRQRKINRRIAGGEGGKGNWYQKWHARWFCRQWTLHHQGEIPRRVQLYKITYDIPTPEYVAEHGPYDPVERMETLGKDTLLHTADCAEEVGAQPVNVIRARYGLPPADNVKRWNAVRNKKRLWDARLEREAYAEQHESQGGEDGADE
ncbi:MAG: hypothetical protein KDK70_31100, partial [Myxococcales bacterium]|nr:hypothetical protein [Myxococcales bacterium]